MHNPTGVQMPYSELKFMQWVINASQYTPLRCKLVSSLTISAVSNCRQCDAKPRMETPACDSLL